MYCNNGHQQKRVALWLAVTTMSPQLRFKATYCTWRKHIHSYFFIGLRVTNRADTLLCLCLAPYQRNPFESEFSSLKGVFVTPRSVCVWEIALMRSLSLFCVTAPGCLIWYSKCPLIIREFQGEKVEKKNCHSKFIYIPQCVRPVVAAHGSYPFVSGPHRRIRYSLCCHAWF